MMGSFNRAAATVFLAAAALLCVSCSKTTVITVPEEIAFDAFGMPMTRAAYPEDEVFGVYACQAGCGGGTAWDASDAWPQASSYFADAAFKNIGGNWAGYDIAQGKPKPYFWPSDGSLMFAGYSPHKDASGETITSVAWNPNREDLSVGVNPYLQIGFTQKTDISQMVDLMWFDVKDVNGGKTMTKESGVVNIDFRHALSKVTLNFSGSQNIYKLTSVKLKDCINTATFYSGKTAGWMPDLDVEKLVDFTLLGSEVTLNGWKSPENLLIIPQYLDGIFPVIGTGSVDMGIDVILAFTVTDGYGSQEIEIPLKNYTERWVMGKHYVYNIAVNADPIDFGSPNISITTQTVTM